MSQNRISTTLCANHFNNLRQGKPCENCPSLPENERRILTDEITKDKDNMGNILLISKEIALLRKDHTDIKKDIQEIHHAIQGNGKKGMIERLLTIEFKFKEWEEKTKLLDDMKDRLITVEQKQRNNVSNKNNTITLIGLIFSILVGLISLIMGIVS